MIKLTNQEQRKHRKINELGRDAKCCRCGEDDITALGLFDGLTLCQECRAGNTGRPIKEAHHIIGKHEGETIPLPLNGHTNLTDKQLDWPEGTLDKNRTPEMKAVAFVYSMADILEYLAELCRKFANILYDFITSIQGVSS
jgi:hypothetical protein